MFFIDFNTSVLTGYKHPFILFCCTDVVWKCADRPNKRESIIVRDFVNTIRLSNHLRFYGYRYKYQVDMKRLTSANFFGDITEISLATVNLHGIR